MRRLKDIASIDSHQNISPDQLSLRYSSSKYLQSIGFYSKIIFEE